MSPQDDPTDRLSTRYQQLTDRLSPVWNRIEARFTVDTRALAAARITLATILLLDLVHRTADMTFFYTDQGAYPVEAYQASYLYYNGLSIHALSGDLWFQQLLFVIAGLFALAMLVGYRTRFVTFVSFLLLLSLHARNPAVLNGGDRLFRILIFIAIVPPMGERWSVDALRRGSARSTVVGFGTAALLLQPIIVFTSNAILKHRGDNWYAGEGLEIALLNDGMRIFMGNVIVEYPPLMTAMNYAWVLLVAGSSVYLLATVGRARAVAAMVYLGAFVGMATSMAVGWFPLILFAAVLPFLTPPFWDWIARRVPWDVSDRLPDREILGPLSRPPIEQRVLDGLRDRGYPALAEYPRSLLTVVGALVVVWMLFFAAADVTAYSVPEEVDNAHLDAQSWGLYAPDPSTGFDWYVLEVQLANGQTVDPITHGTVDHDRPPDNREAYENFRHRKFMGLVENSAEGDSIRLVVESYGRYACNQAERDHGVAAESVTLYEYYQQSPLDGEYEEPDQYVLLDADCSELRQTD